MTNEELIEKVRMLDSDVKRNEIAIQDQAKDTIKNQDEISNNKERITRTENNFRVLETEFTKFKEDTNRRLDQLEEELYKLNVTVQGEVMPEIEQLQDMEQTLGGGNENTDIMSGSDPYNHFALLDHIK